MLTISVRVELDALNSKLCLHMKGEIFALKQNFVSDAVTKMLYLILNITETVRSTEATSSV